VTKIASPKSWLLFAVCLSVASLLVMSHGVTAQTSMSSDVNVTQSATLNAAILVDSTGMTLYDRTSDPAGGSSCTGGCATTWPPLQPTSATPSLDPMASGTLSVINRSDGTQQVAYNGKALYHFSNDKNPGDTNGQGIAGVWFAATP
jgi:predicted lipoprotein with Yx(FWY)xxD motif